MKEDNIGNVLGALAEWVTAQVRSAVALEGLTPAEVSALLVLSKYPDRSIELLRGPLDLSHSGCVRLVDRLVQGGYVERREGEDARRVALHLTRQGLDFARSATEQRAEALARQLHALDAEEREQLGRLASKLLGLSVSQESTALKVCRLCDYAACVECPFDGLERQASSSV